MIKRHAVIVARLVELKMSIMPIVRSLRGAMMFVLLVVSTLGITRQVMGQKYTVVQEYGGQGTALGQFNNPYAMVQDAQGNIIISDVGNHRIQKFSLDGTFISSFGSYGGGPGQFNQPHGLALDSNGNIYVADRNNNRVQVFNSDGVYLRGWGSGGYGPGQFDNPRTIRVDKVAGIVFVADDWGRRIQQFTLNGTFIKEFGGYGTGPSQFQLLQGFQLDALGNIWAVDRWAAEVRKFDRDGNLLQKFGSHGSGPGQFDYPSFIDIDSAGFLYVHEGVGDIPGHRNRIQKFSAQGIYITEMSDLTTDLRDSFLPSELFVLANGDVLVADYGGTNQRVLRFKPEWPKYRFARQFGGLGSVSGSLNGPWGIAINKAGLVFVSEYGNQRIQWFSQDGVSLGTFSNTSGPGGVLDSLTMSFGPSGDLYAADRFNHRVVNFNYNNNALSVSRVIGSYGSGSSQFNMPHGLSVDTLGNFYVADLFNSRVVAFDPLGNLLWMSGSLGSGLGQMNFLHDTAVTNDRHILVADTSNHRITVLDSTGTAVTTFGGYGQLPGQMNNPKGIGTAMNGLIAVPEEAGQRVQLFLPDYSLLQVVGGPGNGSGLFHNPIDVEFDNSNGRMFVVDHVNHLIQIFEPYYDFDSISPTSSISGTSDNLWIKTNITGSITASDNYYGSGVKEIRYAINQGTETIVTGSTASFTLTENGIHFIAYWAVDNVGNVETTKYATVKIDKVAPVSTLTRAGGQLTLSAVDAHSGVSKIKVQVNGGSVVDYSGPFADSVHTVTYWAEDVAGNVEASRTEIVNPGLRYLAISQRWLTGGYGTLGTVFLDAPAPAGGIVVNLSASWWFAFVTVPPTVTVPEGETSATFEIDVVPVVKDEVVFVQARLFETFVGETITIQAPKPYRVTLANATIAGGTSVQGEVSISGPAPDTGVIVALTSSSLSVLVPSTVTIPAGQMSTTFTATSNIVSVDTTATIAATLNGVRTKSTLSILGPKVTSVTVASANVASTATTTGTVTLSTNAPVGGKVVTLSSSNTGVATVPVSVTVPAGANTATFTITAGTVAANTAVTITATTNGSSGTATVTVTPPAAALSTLTTNVAAATGGVAVTGTVTLTRAAPTGGAVIVLASSPTTVGTVPASVTVAAGATTATFTITTRTVTAASTLTVTGTYLGVAKAVSITVNPVRLVSTLTLNPTSVKGGTASTGTVTLTGAATEAVVVTLTSGTTTVATVPASVTVPAGATSATFTITTLAQTATRTSIITARTGTTSKTATLSVTR